MILMVKITKITQILTLSALEGTTTIVGIGLSPREEPTSPYSAPGSSFFPTCQVRVVRFYVSCLLLSSSPLLLLLNCDPRRTVFSAGAQPRPSPPSVPCRASTTTIHAQCSLPDLNREYPRQVFPAGPHVGRYGTKNVLAGPQPGTLQKICQINARRYAR